MFTEKKAVIFDLDGTLIDSLGIWNRVDEILLSELQGPEMTSEAISHFRETALVRHAQSENPYVEFCADLGALCRSSLSGKAIHARRYEISRQLLRTDVDLQPGAVQLLEILKRQGKRLVIATTTKQANIDIYAHHNPSIASQLNFAETFEFILTRDCITHIKPHPEIFLLALHRLGLEASECLVIEDSLAGVEAASAAGIDVIAMKEKWSEKDENEIRSKSIGYFDSFDELLCRISPSLK